jgi:hypothetical protein
MSVPFVKETSHLLENPSNYIAQTNEHLRSKAREFKPYMEERHVRSLPI